MPRVEAYLLHKGEVVGALRYPGMIAHIVAPQIAALLEDPFYSQYSPPWDTLIVFGSGRCKIKRHGR